MNQPIPLSSPDITEAEIAAVTEVLRTSSLSLGPKLIEFESALASFHNMPHAIAVSSGTAGLHLAIRALGIGEGDEVILPSFTFIAAANAVLYERATPVFVDIDPITLNIDPSRLEEAITPRTRAILVVHTFGVPAAMRELMAIANKHNLAVIEDACEAIGATYDDQLTGTFGDVSVFAFYPNKQMTTGEGGAILTRNDSLANRMRAMRNQGRYPSSDWLQHSELGFNYRLPEISCALGIVQLSRLKEMLAARASAAQRYDRLLASLPHVKRPQLTYPDADITSLSWFVYVVRPYGLPIGARDRVLNRLQADGIGCARYFAPIHLQPAYAQLACARNLSLPITESIAQTTLALPFFNRLSDSDAERVVGALAQAIEQEAQPE
jgi:perosamine synthetase